jgi:hypothetical protein
MTTSVKRITCSSCGEEYQPNFRICPGCGTELTAGSSTSSGQVSQGVSPSRTTAGPSVVAPRAAQASSNVMDAWSDTDVAPWRRWAARMLDLNVNGVVSAMTFVFIFSLVAPYETDRFLRTLDRPGGALLDVAVTMLLGSVLTGLVIGLTGSSLGKVIFGIRVTKLDGSLIGPVGGMARDLNVFLKGLGLGLPLISLFTLIFSYKKLKSTGSTSWDLGAHHVTYRPTGNTQYILNTIGILLLLVVSAAAQAFT